MVCGFWCLMPLSTIFLLYLLIVLLVQETGVPEKKTPTCQKLRTPRYEWYANSQLLW